jgi:phosphonate transport system ATP-binding protein
MTVICTLHDLDLIERYASRVVALRDGALVFEGQPEEFDARTFREIYGEDAEPSSRLAG